MKFPTLVLVRQGVTEAFFKGFKASYHLVYLILYHCCTSADLEAMCYGTPAIVDLTSFDGNGNWDASSALFIDDPNCGVEEALWLAPNNHNIDRIYRDDDDAFFVLDLGCSRRVEQVQLRNSKNTDEDQLRLD